MKADVRRYRSWAPDDVMWTEWAKPVLFMNSSSRADDVIIPELKWIKEVYDDTMVIVDLPGAKSVEEGLALARLGYRPVPLYNGVCSPKGNTALVDTRELAKALNKGAEELDRLTIKADAPPAFLLDFNRMQGQKKKPGSFDNRWCVFAQDMPSALLLKKNGIQRVVVQTYDVQNDLAHILHRYHQQGIQICRYRFGKLQELPVAKPSRFKSILYRYKTITGLTRNAAGGFGGMIPEPTQSSSGTRYYGIG